jgi:hypothetical protein
MKMRGGGDPGTVWNATGDSIYLEQHVTERIQKHDAHKADGIHIGQHLDLALQREVHGRAQHEKGEHAPVLGAAPLVARQEKGGKALVHGEALGEADKAEKVSQHGAGKHDKGVDRNQHLQPRAARLTA